MYIYSKKSRRRMHAIPAAIALGLVALSWLASSGRHAHAEPLLTAQNLAQWETDCQACEVSGQYDIVQGDVVYLTAQGSLSMTRWLKPAITATQLSWRWSVDPYVDGGTLLRVTLHIKETANWPARTLHYVWDSEQATGSIETLSDFEHRIVVTGSEGEAESWYSINRDLNADWAAIYNEPMPAIEEVDVGLGMPEMRAVTGGFVNAITLQSQDPAPQSPTAIAISE